MATDVRTGSLALFAIIFKFSTVNSKASIQSSVSDILYCAALTHSQTTPPGRKKSSNITQLQKFISHKRARPDGLSACSLNVIFISSELYDDGDRSTFRPPRACSPPVYATYCHTLPRISSSLSFPWDNEDDGKDKRLQASSAFHLIPARSFSFLFNFWGILCPGRSAHSQWEPTTNEEVFPR